MAYFEVFGLALLEYFVATPTTQAVMTRCLLSSPAEKRANKYG